MALFCRDQFEVVLALPVASGIWTFLLLIMPSNAFV